MTAEQKAQIKDELETISTALRKVLDDKQQWVAFWTAATTVEERLRYRQRQLDQALQLRDPGILAHPFRERDDLAELRWQWMEKDRLRLQGALQPRIRRSDATMGKTAMTLRSTASAPPGWPGPLPTERDPSEDV